jgi:hypothetical protein
MKGIMLVCALILLGAATANAEPLAKKAKVELAQGRDPTGRSICITNCNGIGMSCRQNCVAGTPCISACNAQENACIADCNQRFH